MCEMLSTPGHRSSPRYLPRQWENEASIKQPDGHHACPAERLFHETRKHNLEHVKSIEDARRLLRQVEEHVHAYIQQEIEDAERDYLCEYIRDKHCFVRYLKATNFQAEEALRMLKETLKWRKSFKPDSIDPAEVEPESVTGKNYVNGFDRHGRPILILRPGRENTKTEQRQLKFLVFNIERALRLLPSHFDNMLIIIDYEGYTLANAPSIASSLETLKILSEHYPGKICVSSIIDSFGKNACSGYST